MQKVHCHKSKVTEDRVLSRKICCVYKYTATFKGYSGMVQSKTTSFSSLDRTGVSSFLCSRVQLTIQNSHDTNSHSGV